MKVACPSCGEVAQGADIDLGQSRAVCRACGELFPLPNVTAAPDEASVPAALRRFGALVGAVEPSREVALDGQGKPLRPDDLRWSEQADGARFAAVLGQARFFAIPILGFAAVWNAFLLFWYTTAFGAGGGPAGLMFWFPLIHVGAGLYITYRGLCLLLNSAHVAVADGELRFRRGPIPERGAVRILVDDVRRVTALETKTSGKNGPTFTWDAQLETRDGRSVRLKLDLASRDGAEYIAFRLEDALARARRPELPYRG